MANSGLKISKGEKIKLSKYISYKEEAYIAITWNTKRYKGERDFDLDLSFVCLDENGVCQDDKYFVWFKHKVAPLGAITHSGDNRVGVSDNSDAETGKIVLSKLPSWVKSVAAVVTIFDHEDDQHFGLVDNAAIRIMDSKKEEKLRFPLSEEAHVAQNVGMIFGQLNRINDEEWEFVAIEEGSQNGLEEYIEYYGMDLLSILKKYSPQDVPKEYR